MYDAWNKMKRIIARPTHNNDRLCHVNTILSRIIKSFSISTTSTSFTRHILTKEEMDLGCKAGLDTWADTCCVGKHVYVREVIEGKLANANGFAAGLPTVEDIPIVHCTMAYDDIDGNTYLLEVNNALYLGENIKNVLLCPNQCESNNIQIDLRPSQFYPNVTSASTMKCSDELVIPILHDGPLPYFNIRHPTQDELENCPKIELTSYDEWDPYDLNFNFSATLRSKTTSPSEWNECNISRALMSNYHYDRMINSCNVTYDFTTESTCNVNAFATRRKDSITPEQLVKLWNIGLSTAKRTLSATTHQCIRSLEDIRRRFRTDRAHLRYKRLSESRHGKFYVDTLFSKVKSIRGYTCGNLFVNTLGFKKFFPLKSESEGKRNMLDFIQIVGIPPSIHSDDAKVFQHGDFKKTCQKHFIKQTFTEPYSPWQNRAEAGIREVKSYARKLMQKVQAPIRLWCFAYEYASEVLSLCATGSHQLQGRTAYEHVMNYTPDISEYISFSWFQWAYYWDEIAKEKVLCRWLGVAHYIGQSMCYYVIKSNGSFIARSTVIPVPHHELDSNEMKNQTTEFMSKLQAAIGDHTKAIVNPQENLDETDLYNDCLYIDDNEESITYPWDDEWKDIPLQDETAETQKDLDTYIGSQVVLPDGNGNEVLCRVKGRKRTSDGAIIGTYNSNPILDTRVFDVEYPDGRIEAFTTNMIAESLYSNVDDEGFTVGLLDEIVDHDKTDDAVEVANGFTGNNNSPVITTKGWRIKVKWCDGSHDWLPLHQVKNSNPVELAEYACKQNIEKEPAFNWWVKHVIKKRTRMVNKVKTRMRKGNMKFGIIIPTTVKEALALDRDNGNTYWEDAIKKEYDEVSVAFKLLKDGQQVPPSYQEITCHLIFEVKFDLRRKARYVAGGHLTETPTHMTYSSVVSRESVRIAFLVAALNGLDVWAADIQNAYLNADTEERVWFRAGEEWGEHQGKPVLIVKALYGLKGSGKAWRSHLAHYLRDTMGFESSYGDPDMWFKAAVKPNGEEYYSYLLIYVDDVISVDMEPKKNIDLINEKFTIKKGSAGPPSIYLGANIQKLPTRTGGECWGMSCEQYVKDAVKHVKTRLKEEGFEFNKRLSDIRYSPQQPYSTLSYRPELDSSEVCSDSEANYYQNLIGVLRWIVELGRIDINYEVACLSQYLAYPRRGHLHQALHIFKYLDIHHESFLRFDPTYLELEEPLDLASNPKTKAKVLKEFYPDAVEAIPTNAPEPRGKAVQINCFVDADHAGNLVTRRSHTGILIYLNMAPIFWYSKKQNTVETSTFSSEFVALKIATEKIISLRYKLRMLGIPILGPANVFCDNEGVYKNVSIGASVLKKKHNSIAYHKCRESVACGIMNIFKEDGDSNLADILTKSLGKVKRVSMRMRIMFDEKVKLIK